MLERLKLDRVRRDIGDVERGERVGGGGGVVVGRSADQREAGERDDGIDRRPAVLHEELLDRRPRIEARCKDRHNPQPTRLERLDHAVVMPGIPGKHIGAQHEQADRAASAADGKRFDAGGDAAFHARVIDADIRIFRRRLRLQRSAQRPALAIGVAVDKRADHMGDVFLGARQPILEREEIGAYVLRGAGNISQDLRQTAQHRHLLGAADAHIGAGFRLRAQALQEGKRAFPRAVHEEAAHPRQAHDVAGRHAANHCVATLAPRLQGRQDQLDVVLDEHHRTDDDVAGGNVGDAAL